MMRKLLLLIFICCGLAAHAQIFNNEWIDYSKTYYKFKIGKTGLYRIGQSTLAAAGLSNIPAEQFQLWRNGVQIPIYTSLSGGIFSAGDYIEFWGQMNDGSPDKELYRNPAFQLNQKWSLISDTAAYFLTVNTNTAQNKRLQNTTNNIAGNNLTAEPYFMYTAGQYFKSRINPGEAVNVETYLYSSSYDRGEGWTSPELLTSYSNGFTYGTLTDSQNNLFPFSSGPAAKISISVSGNIYNRRRYKVTLNGDSLTGNTIQNMNFSKDSAFFSPSLLNSGNANIVVTNITACDNPPFCPVSDRMVVHQYEITYPRQFNFGGAKNFEFTLPSSVTPKYLEISGFSFGVAAPVLYDLTNGKRYTADITAAPLVRIVLDPSVMARNLVLVNEELSNITTLTTLQTRNFINYTSTANQGDYLIISHSSLYNPSPANPVEEYRAYRSSIAGGSFNAKVYLSDELIDQFGFGIHKNPAGIRNFIRFARNRFSQSPRFVFIIGKGLSYDEQRNIEIANNSTNINNAAALNLVPTFGWPGSDILLAAEPGSYLPEVPIGRLSAINVNEASVYLKKMKEYEQAQRNLSPKLEDRLWMKNVAHIVGANSEGLDQVLGQYMAGYEQIIEDTLFGARVTTFRKGSGQTGDPQSGAALSNLFREGMSLITYFGHSSAITLDFNLDDPQNYSNPGKYPLFIGLGCNAGNFFRYNPVRFTEKETISEKYVLAPDRGTIGFIASTHFGEVSHLNSWNTRAYERISRIDYGKSIGEIMKNVVSDVFAAAPNDFLTRLNSEQTELHGDPALKINTHPKPDYAIEDQLVKINPSFISIADASFNVQVKTYNMGMAVNRKIVLEVKRQFPVTGTIVTVRRDTLPGIRYADSISFSLPIDRARDKGLNKIIVTIDADNNVDESYESNNTITKDVMIYEDEARTVYPYNFAIVGKQNIKLAASTADPLSSSKQYRMEMDTTELFNSGLKITRNVTAPGGLIEFDPGISFTDSTVYYWRVAVVPPTGPVLNWSTSSFNYIANSEPGFNQSHLYQHLKSSTERIYLDSASRQWKYRDIAQNLFIRHGTWVSSTSQEAGLAVAINFNDYIRNTCAFSSVVFNVFDPVSLKPMANRNSGSSASGLYGSSTICDTTRTWNFEYRYTDSVNRRKAKDFMQNTIPDGAYVVVRSFALDPKTFPGFPQAFASDWKTDQGVYGPGNTLYDALKNAGLTTIDSFNRPRQFVLVYKKNDPSFQPRWLFTDSTSDNKTLSVDLMTRDTVGFITSPVFGPAKSWKELRWRGNALETPSADNATISVIGIRANGVADTLVRNLNLSQQNFSLSSINAAQYPYLQLRMRNADSVAYTPYQLRYWRIIYVPVPEGAIAPNILFTKKDPVSTGELLDFKIAFKNVSDAPFDSVKIKMVITDRNNVQHVIAPFKMRPLPGSDTLHVRYPIDTRQLTGQNILYVEVNPDNDQPEQYHFNNFIYTSFTVGADTLNPLLDVTFDNVHIINNDIVSARPNIVIKLQDESSYLITDPATVSVQVKYPNGSTRTFNFNSDTLKFIPPSGAPNTNNTATILFNPAFLQDGSYELIVSGKDMSNNGAGSMQYRVAFQVINKAMISNMLNYPNPFTTSTAFVFTLTGSEVPQNLKIQVLTVTGKVVREITKDELGPLRIGRNITEFKWDGTDQFGQKLANGIYLYRVITNLNNKSLEKYSAQGDQTDKFFNKGYGKIYLMR